MLSAE
ncbi:Protein of unknown function [Bacillus mycoides]